jgi:hypothetical protein
MRAVELEGEVHDAVKGRSSKSRLCQVSLGKLVLLEGKATATAHMVKLQWMVE